MWPFSRQPVSVPTSISQGDLTATYNSHLKHWVLPSEGVDFHISGVTFDEAAFGWVKEILSTLRSLETEIRTRVDKVLEGWPCNKSATQISSVDLSVYGKSKRFNIDYSGDDSWGDFYVVVVIQNETIIDVYGED